MLTRQRLTHRYQSRVGGGCGGKKLSGMAELRAWQSLGSEDEDDYVAVDDDDDDDSSGNRGGNPFEPVRRQEEEGMSVSLEEDPDWVPFLQIPPRPPNIYTPGDLRAYGPLPLSVSQFRRAFETIMTRFPLQVELAEGMEVGSRLDERRWSTVTMDFHVISPAIGTVDEWRQTVAIFFNFPREFTPALNVEPQRVGITDKEWLLAVAVVVLRFMRRFFDYSPAMRELQRYLSADNVWPDALDLFVLGMFSPVFHVIGKSFDPVIPVVEMTDFSAEVDFDVRVYVTQCDLLTFEKFKRETLRDIDNELYLCE